MNPAKACSFVKIQTQISFLALKGIEPAPLDRSSGLLSELMDVSKYGMLFGGIQMKEETK